MIGIAVLIATYGSIMVATTIGDDPLIQADNVQHYAYRAVEAGLNTFESVINNNPNLAHCDSSLNASPLCTGLHYQVWNSVPGTTGTNGVIPEYYLIDNPQPQIATNGSLTSLNVEIIGAAGYPGRFVYQTIDGEFQPINGYLVNVWWSDYAGSNPNGTGTEYQHIKYNSGPNAGNYEGEEAGQCSYIWQTSSTPAPYKLTNNATGGARGDVGPCGTGAPPFTSGDTINGPLYSNDSIKVSNNPNFGIPWPAPVPPGTPQIVTTADPLCQFADAANLTNCGTTTGVYSPSSTFNHPIEQSPVDDAALQTIASAGGCLYQGPTQITLVGNQMKVISPDTPASPGPGANCPNPAAVGATWTGTTGLLPGNGVVYVQTASAVNKKTGANPFDDSGNLYPSDSGKYAQTLPSCSGCYDGQSASPDEEGDAFIQGHLAGLLTVGTDNDIVIDGNLTYDDCVSWAATNPGDPVFGGSQQESACQYNTSASGHGNDALGLIADQFIEVDHPIDPANTGDVLPFCNGPNSVMAKITHTSEIGGVVTVTANNSFAAGESVAFSGLNNGFTGLNGNTYTVLSAGLSSTKFEITSSVNGASSTAGSAVPPGISPTMTTVDAAPLCTPNNNPYVGLNDVTQGNLIIDASVLALNQSFANNNPYAGPNMDQILLYGSIQQEARGPIGGGTLNADVNGKPTSSNNHTGYGKFYTYDPRLELVSPPAISIPPTAPTPWRRRP